MNNRNPRIREIPYNYTSFSDREIVIYLLGEPLWDVLNKLRDQRRTGRSARMLFEVLGDIWVVRRNPFIQDDLIANIFRRLDLIAALEHRLDQIIQRAATTDDTNESSGGANSESHAMSTTERRELVLRLASETRNAVTRFATWLAALKDRRKTIRKRLVSITKSDNIQFDAMSRVAHVTDATDWRVEYPFVVITPDTEAETPALVKACIDLGLTIVPRGGGTGYTGGGIPLDPETAVINTEKLDHIGQLESQILPGLNHPVPIVEVGAGVVTRRVSEFASAHNLVFAVDPTSQDASTIGGNISVNAGGKKAVRWGVTLDNLASWRMVSPNADWLIIERINHNLSKLQEVATAEFKVTRLAANNKTPIGVPEYIKVPVSELRTPGLGKDVTNKFLAGIPGVQKEGCDGLITSAKFILHKPPTYIRTVCLEFFGLVKDAVPAILETKQFIDNTPNVELIGSEHMDERYVKAVRYGTKAARPSLPKMVLLLDIGGNDAASLDAAVNEVVQIANIRGAEGFIATSPEARARFWQDRSRTAAIAAHTNAFKINEDVVIPLERLAEYSDGIERINIEQSIHNKLIILDNITVFLSSNLDAFLDNVDFDRSSENATIIAAKQESALQLLTSVTKRWQAWLTNLDKLASDWLEQLPTDLHALVKSSDTVLDLLQRRDLRISFKAEVSKYLKEIFAGDELAPIRDRIEQIHSSLRASRIFVATHMHAGDGNVHTNIPVFSNDYAMLKEAENLVERIMNLARSLGGVISGEHGIGITKFRFLGTKQIVDFATYKSRVDPKGNFNRGKLLAGSGMERAYTPSLRLVQQEALILEATALGQLNDMIRHCLRCGKCKPVCTTHVPRANLLYSPRNKILASGLIIEAVLYEEQTRRGISLHHLAELNDISEHCTVCRRCAKPCPVHIDFADVTARMRTILRTKGKKDFHYFTWASMQFLKATDPRAIAWLRWGLIRGGYAAQRLASAVAARLGLVSTERPSSTTGPLRLKPHIINFFQRPMPDKIPRHPLRRLIQAEDPTQVAIIRDPKLAKEGHNVVFYFPGCGSERMFTQIGLATLAMLYYSGAEVILAPGYLCCGYPQIASGDADTGRGMATNNQILFHRVANTLNYLDIKTVLVSCGTCLGQLKEYQFSSIFPGSRLIDIHEYLAEQGLKLDGTQDVNYLYHDPCHSPIKTRNATDLTSQLMGKTVRLSDRCCGEAGTFAITRPDIATQVRFRKQEELQLNIANLENEVPIKVLTSCPACFQGLSRYRDQVDIEVSYPVIEMAKTILGPNWERQFIGQLQNGGLEKVLL
ncbi:FAD-linked oxidase [Achromatium sp. WMS2]|nr:FAD-linked oxidase [Achromatium sp. WMS2]